MNYLDVAVSATSLVEIAVFYTMTLPVNPMLFRLLRIGKLVRAVRMVHMTSMPLGIHVMRQNSPEAPILAAAGEMHLREHEHALLEP